MTVELVTVYDRGMGPIRSVAACWMDRLKDNKNMVYDVRDATNNLMSLFADAESRPAAYALCCAVLNAEFPANNMLFGLRKDGTPDGNYHNHEETRKLIAMGLGL